MKKLKTVRKAETNQPTKETKPRTRKPTRRQLMVEQLNALKRIPNPTKDEVEKIKALEKTIEASKRGSRSKNKGGNYERDIAKVFKKAFGIELTRTPQSGGFAKKSNKAQEFRGDIVSIDEHIELNLHIECKNAKTWSLPAWLRQSQSDCPKGKVPIVVFHKHGTSEDYVAIKLDDFNSIVKPGSIFKEV